MCIAYEEFRFFKLPTRHPGCDGNSHRRLGGGCPAPFEPVHGAPLPPLGCASADGYSAGGTAPPATAASQPEAVEAACRDAAPLPQEPGEQHLLQLFVSQQAAQGALHPAL